MTAKQYFTVNVTYAFKKADEGRKDKPFMLQKTHSDDKYCQIMQIRKHTLKRMTASAVCIFFITASALSSAFVSVHTDHSHEHNGAEERCSTCILLATAENLFKTVFTVIINAVFAFTCLNTVFYLYNTGADIDFFTPIRLKVKLNN